VRREFPVLAQMLCGIEDVHELSVTTNGFLLERDAERLVRAGIDRFNVSVDSLQRDRFYKLTRRDALDQVLRGLELLATFPEAHPIKVNRWPSGASPSRSAAVRRAGRRTPYEIRSSSSCRSMPTGRDA